ncbi:hypothetical protein KC19_3G157300 [Ceratodon purpureus]|uniref:Uncharacterized protein n=1 Tax=Ceratodon purpureus TaxID=3225 RepID=A0A8T0ILE6_CERPU|nr:hypothetical protein KC19_3G157300 [Ceratodon purpureus]
MSSTLWSSVYQGISNFLSGGPNSQSSVILPSNLPWPGCFRVEFIRRRNTRAEQRRVYDFYFGDPNRTVGPLELFLRLVACPEWIQGELELRGPHFDDLISESFVFLPSGSYLSRISNRWAGLFERALSLSHNFV